MKRKYPEKSVRVGARGTWCAKNDELLQQLGIPKRVATWMVTDVLVEGLAIHRDFGRVVWDPGNV